MNKTKKAIGLLVITCATIAAILATIQTLSGELQSKIGYGYGNGIFFSKNHNKAFKWFLKSAERGNAKGQSNVGVCYYYGYGTEKNYGKAFEFYKKSADQGYSAGQFHLGICYLEGRGTSVDIPKAIHYLELAKKQNQPKRKCQSRWKHQSRKNLKTKKKKKKGMNPFLQSNTNI